MDKAVSRGSPMATVELEISSSSPAAAAVSDSVVSPSPNHPLLFLYRCGQHAHWISNLYLKQQIFIGLIVLNAQSFELQEEI
jgi:hypothetical protein